MRDLNELSMKHTLSIANIKGFTLIELLVVLTLAAILTLQVVPAFHQLVQSLRISTLASNIERTLRFARSRAVFDRQQIGICPSADGAQCIASDNWSSGWITFVDQTEDNLRNENEIVIDVQVNSNNTEIRYNRTTPIIFNSKGRITQSGTIRLCDPNRLVSGVDLVMIHSARIRRQTNALPCR